jgi:branched-chain amino acid transport system ATP-binding protein
LTLLKADIPEAGYGKKIVLRNVALTIEEGEIVGLIGPNGAGKSTLLKVLMGILKIPQGSIQLNGAMITNRNPDFLVKSGMSFIPQGNRVFTELTVAENLELGGYILNSKDEVVRRIEQILETFPDLNEKLKQNAGKLSGGEKQQLALARALMLQPKLLLMDEPSLGLSPKLVARAFETIKKVNVDFKTTILLVEQKVHEVLKIAHRVYALRMGEVVFSGTPSELESGDVMKRIFLV